MFAIQGINEDRLRDYFAKFGAIENVIHKGGYAFVAFADTEAAQRVLNQGEVHTLGGDKFNVRASDSAKRPKHRAAALDKQQVVHEKQVYVANLPRDASHRTLLERFGKLGELQDCLITYDQTTGVPRFAKVTFQEVADYEAALARQQVGYQGNVLEIKKSIGRK